MNSLANAARTLSRTVIIAAFLALLAAATAQRASANQQGDPVGKTQQQMWLCGRLGGMVVDTDVVRTVGGGVLRASHTCKGGLLDGVTCHNFDTPILDYCERSSTRTDELPEFTPTDGIQAEPDALVPTIESADEVIEPVEAAEEPAIIEPAGDEATDPAQEEEGGSVDDGVADEGDAEQGAGDGVLAGDVQDLPELTAAEETTPAEGDPAVDADGDVENTEAQVAPDEDLPTFSVVEDDEQA